MNLYLVQHGEAKTEAEDPQRPLSDRGLAEVDKTAKLLAARARPIINVILHSGKLRSRQTAEILADYLTPLAGVRQVDHLEPTADPNIWADQLSQITENVMLVGHLPHLSRLASLLMCGVDSRAVIQFRNAGIVCLERHDSSEWSIQWILTPGLCE